MPDFALRHSSFLCKTLALTVSLLFWVGILLVVLDFFGMLKSQRLVTVKNFYIPVGFVAVVLVDVMFSGCNYIFSISARDLFDLQGNISKFLGSFHGSKRFLNGGRR
jgi:hypothetical protein